MKKMYLLIVAALFIGGNAFAQYGQTFGQTGLIDPEFNKTGVVTTPYSSTADMIGHTSVLQPDGKIIMAGGNGSNQVTLVRFRADGTADYSFGTNGKSVITAATGSYLGGNSASLAVQPDGKIIFATAAASQVALVRLKANGTADSTFGTAGIRYAPATPLWSSQVYKVLVKPDGKILTGGTGAYNVTTPYYEVVQFLADGTVDSSFATNGFFHFSCGAGGGGYSIALLPNNHIAVAGVKYPIGVMGVLNLLPTGKIDSTWGTNGLAVCQAFLNAKALFCRVALQNDNKVLVLGYGNWSGGRKAIGLGRFKTDGKPDSTFAYQGTLTTTFENFSDYAQNVNEQFDGTLVVSGYSNNKFAMMRLKSNGTTDTTYGRLGKVLTLIPGNSGIVNYSFMQPDGKLVLTGPTKLNNVYSFVAARFVVTPNPHYNTLKGYTFFDANSNGIFDSTESYAYNFAVRTIKANSDTIITQSSNGKFLNDVLDTGTYVSNVIIPPAAAPYYTSPVPLNHITSNTTYFNVDSVAFYFTPIPGICDVNIYLFPCTSVRPGFTALYGLRYGNAGTAIANGTIEFIKPSQLWYTSASVLPSSISGDTIRFDYTNLLPNQTGFIVVNMLVPAPPVVNIGDSINSSASISSVCTDINLSNNTSTLLQIATGSYDPNNKLENHAGKITAAQAAAGEYLNYTINFQNTGTDTAINIFIRDTLSSNLDWSTLEMTGASANYQLIMNGDKCLWAFNNIYLPDSGTNNAASGGYLAYRVKVKPTVQAGDVINNTAAIYFDYNLPIYTNTNVTTVVSEAQPLKLLAFSAKKDGKTNRLDWMTAQEINVDRFEVQRSSDGRAFSKIGSVKSKSESGENSYEYTDDKPETRNANYYRLKMIDKDGSFTYSKIVQLSIVNYPLSIVIYPNPAKDKLQVQIDNVVGSRRGVNLRVQVVGQDGKVMLSTVWSVNEGSVVKTINTSTLQSGSYFLKLTSLNPPPGGSGAETVKFEKL